MIRWVLDWWCRRYHTHAHRTVWSGCKLSKQVIECRLCLRTWVRWKDEEGESW